MNYIRHMRVQKGYNPETSHCVCGLDADLIMLALASHEPNFYILREKFFFKQSKPNGEYVFFSNIIILIHEAPIQKKKKKKNHPNSSPISPSSLSLLPTNSKPLGPFNPRSAAHQHFEFVYISELRGLLLKEFFVLRHSLWFGFDLERILDDFVFVCFFVGNDFLPHLPCFTIYEGAIDRLIMLYKVLFFISLFLYFFISLFLYFFISLFLYFFISLFLYFFISLFLYFFISLFLYFFISLFLYFFISLFLYFFSFLFFSFLCFLCSIVSSIYHFHLLYRHNCQNWGGTSPKMEPSTLVFFLFSLFFLFFFSIFLFLTL